MHVDLSPGTGERLRPTSPVSEPTWRLPGCEALVAAPPIYAGPMPQTCRVEGCKQKQTSGHLICSTHLRVLG